MTISKASPQWAAAAVKVFPPQRQELFFIDGGDLFWLAAQGGILSYHIHLIDDQRGPADSPASDVQHTQQTLTGCVILPLLRPLHPRLAAQVNTSRRCSCPYAKPGSLLVDHPASFHRSFSVGYDIWSLRSGHPVLTITCSATHDKPSQSAPSSDIRRLLPPLRGRADQQFVHSEPEHTAPSVYGSSVPKVLFDS